jgi:GNAT superfamily N-acetyltransferase
VTVAYPQVIAATIDDVPALTDVITRGFIDLDPTAWLIEPMDERRHYFRRWVELEVLDAVQCGAIYTTTKRDGCVLFRYAPGKALREHIDGFDTLMADAVGPHLPRFGEFDEAMQAARPPSGSWDIYIPLMGVAPEYQRQGIGTALLKTYFHNVADVAGHTVYLEAGSAAARQFYLTLGFQDHGEKAITLPPDGPTMWPMLRMPATPDLASLVT